MAAREQRERNVSSGLFDSVSRWRVDWDFPLFGCVGEVQEQREISREVLWAKWVRHFALCSRASLATRIFAFQTLAKSSNVSLHISPRS